MILPIFYPPPPPSVVKFTHKLMMSPKQLFLQSRCIRALFSGQKAFIKWQKRISTLKSMKIQGKNTYRYHFGNMYLQRHHKLIIQKIHLVRRQKRFSLDRKNIRQKYVALGLEFQKFLFQFMLTFQAGFIHAFIPIRYFQSDL